MKVKSKLTLDINGEKRSVMVEPGETLLSVLRSRLGLVGTKKGCEEGECGACTVLVDDLAVKSCLMLAEAAAGRQVVTIEGLGNSELDPIQAAFIAEGAIQCGYCSPGMIMSAKALLMRNPQPTVDDIKEAISGNICRCTGYQSIIRAIQKVAPTGNI